jgi:predicted SAM-dependent methyltransferase
MRYLGQVEGIRLHIGGEEVGEGWSILNIQPGPNVDYVGHCADLSAILDASRCDVYPLHVLEHLVYNGELQPALKEIHRALVGSHDRSGAFPEVR